MNQRLFRWSCSCWSTARRRSLALCWSPMRSTSHTGSKNSICPFEALACCNSPCSVLRTPGFLPSGNEPERQLREGRRLVRGDEVHGLSSISWCPPLAVKPEEGRLFSRAREASLTTYKHNFDNDTTDAFGRMKRLCTMVHARKRIKRKPAGHCACGGFTVGLEFLPSSPLGAAVLCCNVL